MGEARRKAMMSAADMVASAKLTDSEPFPWEALRFWLGIYNVMFMFTPIAIGYKSDDDWRMLYVFGFRIAMWRMRR